MIIKIDKNNFESFKNNKVNKTFKERFMYVRNNIRK